MTIYILKALISAIIIVAASEVAKRTPAVGGLIAALPFVSVITMGWLWYETKDVEKVSALSWSVVWMVIPTLIFLAVFPLALRNTRSFTLSLLVSSAACIPLYVLTMHLLKRFG